MKKYRVWKTFKVDVIIEAENEKAAKDRAWYVTVQPEVLQGTLFPEDFEIQGFLEGQVEVEEKHEI